LLIGLMVPSMGAARQAAYDSVCKNNLHQLSMTLRIPVTGTASRGRLPTAESWVATVCTANGAKSLACPLDSDFTALPTDMSNAYIVHNHGGAIHF